MNGKWAFVLALLSIWAGIAAWDLLKGPSTNKKISLSATEKQTGSAVRYNVPDFAFTDLSGRSHRLYEFKGKTILLNFWATWCPPCVVEFPQLVALSRKKDPDLIVIAVSVDKDIQEVKRFIKTIQGSVPLNLLIAHDPDKTISKPIFQTLLYPETYVIGPDMTIQRKIAGPLPPDFLSGF